MTRIKHVLVLFAFRSSNSKLAHAKLNDSFDLRLSKVSCKMCFKLKNFFEYHFIL